MANTIVNNTEGKRIVVDPLTRIEGHLRIEAAVENGIITDAYSSGTMIRGIELILKNRGAKDAWAFAGRVCGVCTSIHSEASVRAVENAYGIEIPPSAQLVRNLMQCALFMHDHIVHFYQLHILDWVDVVSALKADPAETAAIAQKMSNWKNNSVGYYKTLKATLLKFVESGQLGIFENGYWGHPGYKLSPEQNLIGIGHYLDALEWQKEVVKIQTIFGGKNPHPNFLVGGMPCAIDMNQANAINMARLNVVKQQLDDAQVFIREVCIPDNMMIASVYKDEWTKLGGGVVNYLSYGDFPTGSINDVDSFFSPRGVVVNRDLSTVHPIDVSAENELQEFVAHAWYTYKQGDDIGLHPYYGETIMNYTGPKPPYNYLNVEDRYSWIKTPRWKGMPMEVGPLARMIVAYAYGKNQQKEMVDKVLKDLDLPFDAVYSTTFRTMARSLECELVSDWAQTFYSMLTENIKNGDTRMVNQYLWKKNPSIPQKVRGFGLTEAPRGALAHFVDIENEKVQNYQMVVPTTWNGSPRDAQGQRSPFEASLLNTPIWNPDQPLEILRTIHSFDPCLACAVHLYDEDGKYVHQFETF